MRHCPWCRGSILQAEQSLPTEDRDGVLVVFRQCPTCHCLLPSYPDAASDAMEETRTQVEYHEEFWQDLNHLDLDLDAARGRVLAREIRSNLPDLPGTDRKTIAEIGFGRGNLLFALRRQGFDVIGCEPSKELYKVARHAYALSADSIRCTDADSFLATLAASGRRVDALLFWHVLEHLHEPGATLAAYRTRFEDAVIFTEFPIAITRDIYAEHLTFPTPRTFLHMADELKIGIREIGIVGDSRLRVTFAGEPPTQLPHNYSETIVDYTAASPLYRDLYQRNGRV